MIKWLREMEFSDFRNVLIIMSILFAILFIGAGMIIHAAFSVNKSEYDSAVSEKLRLENQIQVTETKLEKAEKDYKEYKEKMLPYEKLQAEAASAPTAAPTAAQTLAPTSTSAPVEPVGFGISVEKFIQNFNSVSANNRYSAMLGKITTVADIAKITTTNSDVKMSCETKNGYATSVTIDVKVASAQLVGDGLYYMSLAATAVDPTLSVDESETFIANLIEEGLDGNDHKKIKNGITYIININSSSAYLHIEK